MCLFISAWEVRIRSTHLSSSQVAEALGISQSTLVNMLRDPDSSFPEPDVVIADRFQGWAPETIDAWQNAERDSTKIHVDYDRLRTFANTIEQSAEWVRISVPRVGDSPREGAALARMLADEISRVAFDLLIEGRAFTSISHSAGMAFSGETGVHWHLFGALPVYALAQPYNVDPATCITQIRQAAQSIDAIASQLSLALSSSRTRSYELRLRTATRRLYKAAADSDAKIAGLAVDDTQEELTVPYTYELEIGSQRHAGGTFGSALALAKDALERANRLSPPVEQDLEGVARDVERRHPRIDLRQKDDPRVTIHILKTSS